MQTLGPGRGNLALQVIGKYAFPDLANAEPPGAGPPEATHAPTEWSAAAATHVLGSPARIAAASRAARGRRGDLRAA